MRFIEHKLKNKYRGLENAKYLPISTSAPSTWKVASKSSFVKTTYAEKTKISPTNAVTKDKINVPPKKKITPIW